MGSKVWWVVGVLAIICMIIWLHERGYVNW